MRSHEPGPLHVTQRPDRQRNAPDRRIGRADRRNTEFATAPVDVEEWTTPRGVHFGLITPGDDDLTKFREARCEAHGGTEASLLKAFYLGA